MQVAKIVNIDLKLAGKHALKETLPIERRSAKTTQKCEPVERPEWTFWGMRIKIGLFA